ncbi:MAG: hypothetical protein R3B06_00870 [Kofleriaceae bacterium]
MPPFHVIAAVDLSHVLGGAGPSFGRCGPGDSWKFLGDVRTEACARHDGLVDQYKAEGSSPAMAHLRAAPALPAAIGSYVGVRAGQLAEAARDYLKP